MNSEIEEGNKIIAYSPFASDFVKVTIEHFTQSGNEMALADFIKKLEYCTSWNWIMETAKQIGQLTGMLKNKEKFSFICLAVQSFEIEIVWKAVVNYIKWYNSQTK